MRIFFLALVATSFSKVNNDLVLYERAATWGGDVRITIRYHVPTTRWQYLRKLLSLKYSSLRVDFVIPKNHEKQCPLYTTYFLHQQCALLRNNHDDDRFAPGIIDTDARLPATNFHDSTICSFSENTQASSNSLGSSSFSQRRLLGHKTLHGTRSLCPST